MVGTITWTMLNAGGLHPYCCEDVSKQSNLGAKSPYNEVTTEDCHVTMLEASSAPRSAMHPYSTGKSTPQTGREVVIKQVMKDHKLDVPVTIHVKRNLREMLPQHPDRHCIQTAHTHAN